MNAEFAPLFKLSRAERIQLVEDLWDSLAREDSGPVSDEKRDELRRRKKNFLQHPQSVHTWDQVKDRARAE